MDDLSLGTLFEKECLEVAKQLEQVAKLRGCSLTPSNAEVMVKAAMLLREVVRAV